MKQLAIQLTKNPKVEEWLDEIKTYNTRKGYIFRMAHFFEWYKKPIETFLELSEKQKRHIALKYQAENINLISVNTINMTLGCLNSFLDYHDQRINFKGKIIRKKIDLTSHIFTNGDLTKIFKIGNTKQKAYLSLAVSLGWESSAIVNLKRKTLQGYVERAKSEGKKFFYCSNICEIRKCCVEKDLENCATCDMYMCDRLKKFIGLAPQAGSVLEKLRVQFINNTKDS